MVETQTQTENKTQPLYLHAEITVLLDSSMDVQIQSDLKHRLWGEIGGYLVGLGCRIATKGKVNIVFIKEYEAVEPTGLTISKRGKLLRISAQINTATDNEDQLLKRFLEKLEQVYGEVIISYITGEFEDNLAVKCFITKLGRIVRDRHIKKLKSGYYLSEDGETFYMKVWEPEDPHLVKKWVGAKPV